MQQELLDFADMDIPFEPRCVNIAACNEDTREKEPGTGTYIYRQNFQVSVILRH